MPLSRAAALLATNVVGIKRLMGSGDLEWCQLRAGSTTLLVDEAAVFALRLTRGVLAKQRERRATAATRTAQQRGRSMLVVPSAAAGRQSGIFVRTWDPSSTVATIRGREREDDTQG